MDINRVFSKHKCCENCKWAIYDSVPYGSTSADYLSGCKKEDEVTEEEFENVAECHCYKELDYDI